jgi:phage FluMu gp28-like protein
MSVLDLKLLPRQKEILTHPARFKIVSCGRRFGKSRMAAYKLIIDSISKSDGTYFLVSPNYKETKVIWRMLKKYMPEQAINKVMEGDLYIELKNGSVIFARSGDDPDALRGEGLDGLVLDEAAFLKEEVWGQVLRPALADKQGWAIIISTPKGKNYFYQLFLRGLDESQTEYKSFQYPSWANPLLKPTEIEEMRKSMPEISFRQEVMAEFLDSGGAVFRGLDQVLTSPPEDPIPGEFYMIGVDLGRHEDFTVIKVGKLSEHREVYRERFNQSDWDYIKERIRTAYNKYNKGCVIMDSTGYGDPIYEDLAKEGLNINGINMNVGTKPMLIENLQLMIENKQISLINDPNLTLEFGAYTYTILPSGNVRYEAAKGFHDDEVISTALMAIGMQGGGTQAVGVVEPFDEEKYGERVADYDDLPEVIEWDELEEYEKTKFGR